MLINVHLLWLKSTSKRTKVFILWMDKQSFIQDHEGMTDVNVFGSKKKLCNVSWLLKHSIKLKPKIHTSFDALEMNSLFDFQKMIASSNQVQMNYYLLHIFSYSVRFLLSDLSYLFFKNLILHIFYLITAFFFYCLNIFAAADIISFASVPFYFILFALPWVSVALYKYTCHTNPLWIHLLLNSLMNKVI